MAAIRIPKTPARAFNKHRPISKLLKSQIEHLEWAIRPASERKPYQLPKSSIRTEGEAAARIAELTRRLHPEAGSPPPAIVGPAVVPPSPTKAAPSRKRPLKRRPAVKGGARRRG